MTTFTVTPEPNNVPPRVRIDMDTEVVGSVFTQITVKRNGMELRSQPPLGSKITVGFDYDAPFAVSQVYTVDAEISEPETPDWTESWASLAAWTGDTGSWGVGAGVASSSVLNASITRTVSGAIGSVDVTNPVSVRLELLDAGGVIVVSVECGDGKVTLSSGSGSSQVVGSGSFTLTLSGASASVAGAGWGATRAFTGTPVKVRLVGRVSALQTLVWPTTAPLGMAVDGSGNVFVVDYTNKLVRKYNSAGTQTASWSTTGYPHDVDVDGSGNVFVADFTNKLVRKYNSAGVQTASWSTTGPTFAVDVDSSGNVYVADYTAKLVRKYNSAGSPTGSWSTTGTPYGLHVDSSGNVFVADYTNKLVRKYNSAGTPTASWSTTGSPNDIVVDAAGNVYVTDVTSNLVRKYNSAGTQTASWSTVGAPNGLAVDAAGNVFVADYTNSVVRKFQQAPASVGQIIARLAPSSAPYSASDTTTLDVLKAWLIHPSIPDLSICIGSDSGTPDDGIFVQAQSGDQVTRARKAQIFSPVGRPRDVVVTYGNRKAGDSQLVLFAPTATDRAAVNSIITDQAPLLLRIPPSFGWDLVDDWYSVGDTSDQRTRDRANDNRHSFTLPLTPVDPPVLAQGAEWTWGDVLLTYATWADVLAANDTWLDVLVGPQ